MSTISSRTSAASSRTRTVSSRRRGATSSEAVITSRVQRHVRHERQDDPEECARARHAADVDEAALVLDDLLREREPEPGPALLGGKERIEDAIQVRRRDS